METQSLPLAFGLAALIVLQLVVVRGAFPMRRTVGLFGIGLFAGVIVVGWWLGQPRYLPAASTSGISVAIADDIRKGLAEDDPPHFLILDGGSYSARGVADPDLERRLRDGLGESVRILSVSLAGGNQLERWAVFKRGLGLLTREERERFEAARKTLLLEVHAQYDRYPLVQLRRNRYSDRAYAYLDTAAVVEAFRAEHGDMEWQAAFEQWIDAIAHGSINLMNVGLATRVVSTDEVERSEAYIPLDRAARKYRFRGTKVARHGLKEAPTPAEEFPWRNIELRRDRYRKILGDPPAIVYFSVPTPRVFDLQYARGFCEALEDYSCITHAHWGLLNRLDEDRFWYDDGHMQRRGSEIYTRWLSSRLVDALSGETQE